MHRILILTGPGGDAQGWGDMAVTRHVAEALNAGPFSAAIAYVETAGDFHAAMARRDFDLVWSALYHISGRTDTVGLGGPGALWVADAMDELGIPYIGPDAPTMKQLICKHDTHRLLRERGVEVPVHALVEPGAALPELAFPAFVKPDAESRSVGIADASVVHSRDELARRCGYIHAEFGQAALVEEYMPGPEYTVAMLGNGRRQEFLTGLVTVDPSHYGKYPILRTDLRGVGLTKLSVPPTRVEEAVDLTRRATDALRCWDHVRVDLRLDAGGRLKIMEVNGIPGLKPGKSWSPQLYSLYHPSGEGHPKEYQEMLHLVAGSAMERWGLA
jgi:D-alanine-D-alanine ligase